ncbi:MAG TPA: hypothetical protein VMW04_01325 [Patescibacteria group bacterium]|nr:hypothetical protein [Patescibacteria group bacterium]
MKVYFGSSPRIKEKYAKEIKEIYELVKKFGFKHTSDFIVEVEPKDYSQLKPEELNTLHQKTLGEIKKADICVFEASLQDLSVGFLINFGLDLGKTVIVLSQSKEEPSLLHHVKEEKLIFVAYTPKDLAEKLKEAFGQAKGRSDIRFNFFVTPQILSYLNWLSGRKRVPRAVYLRTLIEREMKKDAEFKEEASLKQG